jgi:DNA-binding transcriptional LysR family regulator
MIVPLARSPDWRRPPVVTLALILVNVLIFLGFQLDDEQAEHEAFAYYFRTELPAIELIMCCAPQHPLAQQAGEDEIDYDDHPMIVVQDTSSQLPRRKIRVRENPKNITVTTIHDKLFAQLDGIGYGTLPLWLAKPYLESGQLVALEDPEPSPDLYLAWRKTDKGRALKWFVETLQEDLKLN